MLSVYEQQKKSNSELSELSELSEESQRGRKAMSASAASSEESPSTSTARTRSMLDAASAYAKRSPCRILIAASIGVSVFVAQNMFVVQSDTPDSRGGRQLKMTAEEKAEAKHAQIVICDAAWMEFRSKCSGGCTDGRKCKAALPFQGSAQGVCLFDTGTRAAGGFCADNCECASHNCKQMGQPPVQKCGW